LKKQESRLIYGCMGLGGNWDHGPITAENVAQAHQVINTSIDMGIRTFDHADVYTFGRRKKSSAKSSKRTKVSGKPSPSSPRPASVFPVSKKRIPSATTTFPRITSSLRSSSPYPISGWIPWTFSSSTDLIHGKGGRNCRPRGYPPFLRQGQSLWGLHMAGAQIRRWQSVLPSAPQGQPDPDELRAPGLHRGRGDL
jgi:hypothetical protein